MNWKDLKEHDNYEINDKGEIRNKTTKKIRKPYKGEYLSVVLSNKKTIHIHRKVAELFLTNPDNLPCVNHKDGNKYNNNVNNLEWVNFSQNIKHGYDNNLINASGENNGRSLLTEKEVKEIRELKKNHTYKELSEKYNVSIGCLKSIISFKTWKNV